MNVVLTKYVPNPCGSPPEIGPDFRPRREESDGGLDPSDEPGIEAAVRLAGDALTIVPALIAELKAARVGAADAR